MDTSRRQKPKTRAADDKDEPDSFETPVSRREERWAIEAGLFRHYHYHVSLSFPHGALSAFALPYSLSAPAYAEHAGSSPKECISSLLDRHFPRKVRD